MITHTKSFLKLAFVFIACTLPSLSFATIISYDLSWNAENGYYATGVFTFEDTSGPLVDETELLSFSLDIFNQSNSKVSGVLTSVENFNFDWSSNTLLGSGLFNSSNGFRINYSGSLDGGIFILSTSFCGDYLYWGDGSCSSIARSAPSLLLATATAVSEPFSLALIGIGLVGIGFSRKQKAA